jgi:hypothetical protein
MSRSIPIGTRNLFANFTTLLRSGGTSAISNNNEDKKEGDALSDEIVEDMVARCVVVRPIEIATDSHDAETKAKERHSNTSTSSTTKVDAVSYPLLDGSNATISANTRSYAADCFFGDNNEGLSIAELIADCLLEVVAFTLLPPSQSCSDQRSHNTYSFVIMMDISVRVMCDHY